MSDDEPSGSILQRLRNQKANEEAQPVLKRIRDTEEIKVTAEVEKRRSQVVTSGETRKRLEYKRPIKFEKIIKSTSPYDKYQGLLGVLDEINEAGLAGVNFNNTEYLMSIGEALEFPTEIAKKGLTLNPATTKDFIDAVTILSSKEDFGEWRKKLPAEVKNKYTKSIWDYEQLPHYSEELAEGLKSLVNPPEDK